jgi:hypothetical protein
MELSGRADAHLRTGREKASSFAWVAASSTAWTAGLTFFVIGPMASKGWVVLLDWVTGPRVAFRSRIFAGSALPAGPAFFGLAAGVHTVAGAAVGWLVPAIVLMVAGLGGAHLASTVTGSRARLPTLLVGVTAALWNPFVHERLYAGQIAVLLGYALLPWLLAASIRVVRELRRGESDPLTPAQLIPAGLWGLMIASSVHFAVIGGIAIAAAATAGLIARRRAAISIIRWWAITTLLTAIVSLAWIAPVANEAPPKGDKQTIEAFATQPDPNFGLLGGTLVQRGFWRVAPGRPGSETGWWWSAAAGVLGGAALLGTWTALSNRRWTRWNKTPGTFPAVAVGTVCFAGIVGWLLGQGPHGLAGPFVRALSSQPGPLGVMREPGKFLALVSMAWIAGLAAFVDLVCLRTRLVPKRCSQLITGSLLVLALTPIVLTPGFGCGVNGRLRATHYPAGWASVRSTIDQQPTGSVVLLPYLGYTDAGFTNGRITRNTAKAYFGPRAELSDDAGVPGLRASERTRAISTALLGVDAGALARLNVRFVVSPNGQTAPVLQALRVVAQTPEAALYVVEAEK